MIVLAALARGREVIVSRGQLVEIGGAYRIPAVMRQSGAILREVGTTNRTHLKDYENAINENTGLILRVHTSNYRVEGFSKEVGLDDLVALGRAYERPRRRRPGKRRPGLAGRSRPARRRAADPRERRGRLRPRHGLGRQADRRSADGHHRGHPRVRRARARAPALPRRALRQADPHRHGGDAAPLPRRGAARRGAPDRRGAVRRRRATCACAPTPCSPGSPTSSRSRGRRVRASVEEIGDTVGAGSLPTVELPGWAVWLRPRDIEAGELARRLRAATRPGLHDRARPSGARPRTDAAARRR